MVMTRKKLLQIIDRDRIKRAIEAAEHHTSGEICVSVAPVFWGSVEKAADKAFTRLGMTRTQAHNGVLFFVVPARRKFVVLGDSGIHDRVGQEFWDSVASAVSERFRAGDFTVGLFTESNVSGNSLRRIFRMIRQPIKTSYRTTSISENCDGAVGFDPSLAGCRRR
jgi:uncharacterized membrane protein